jgi:D-arabinose 1-dehydrogenase-like Zn-dependent alcohol dehydrogenase
MVMNERQVLASRSATRADLVATSDMLAAGAIDAIVSRSHALESVNEALADLADGAVVSR